MLFLESPSADSVVVRVLEEGQPGSASHLLVVNEEVTLKWSDLAEVRLLQDSLAHADIEKDSGGGGNSGGNSAGNYSGSSGAKEMIRPNFW